MLYFTPVPSIDSSIQTLGAAAAELRHRLHQIPELAYQEFETAKTIRTQLDRLRISHIDGVTGAPTATIAVIGDESKPCIALRSDIDALPITEQTGLPYASTHSGRMHACGHDGHMATLMATAEYLKSVEKDLPVCVKLLWQPAEEFGGGARRLVEAGVLDGTIGPKVNTIFGLHGWPGLPVGCVATKAGALLAATDNFSATFIGKGCHGAFPHLGIDPIVTACQAVINLQQLVSREIDPTEPAALTVGKIQAGTATNIIPDQATIEGTVRTLNPSTRELAKGAVKRRCEGIAAANDCSVQFEWIEGYPATVNDPKMADYVARIARQTLGENRFIPVARSCMGGEDFAYYLEKIPGCFFLVGVEPAGAKNHPSLHSDRYDFTDAAIAVGMRMFIGLVQGFRL